MEDIIRLEEEKDYLEVEHVVKLGEKYTSWIYLPRCQRL